jgi:uncharacterized protein (TIGR04222 family)
MTRTLAVTGALLSALMLRAAPAAAQADWHIDDFRTDIVIQPDGRLLVTETIAAAFVSPKHGIYRTIPIHYEVGFHQYSLRFTLLGVTDGSGAARRTKVSRDGYSVRIRIGDPDRTLRGLQVYRIQYEIQRAILHELDRTVLRWNATGNEWDVPITASTTTVTLPTALPDSAVTSDAWTGVYGATSKEFAVRRLDDRTIEYATGALRPREGITVEISMPATAITLPGWGMRLWWILTDNLAYVVFLGVLGGCFLYWYRRGRDVPGWGSIVVQYEPPDGLGPAEVGTLADEQVNMQDISAILVDLAVRGYLEIEDISEKKIIFTTEDYRFTKKREPADLKAYERTLFDGVFEDVGTRKLSDLKQKFSGTVATIRKQVYRHLTANGYFDGNPDTVRSVFAAVAILLTAVLLGGVALFQAATIGTVYAVPLVVAGILSLVVIVIFSRIVPRKTRKGRIAWEKIRGLEEYLRRAEQRELEEQERRNIFERLLPHAIALGLVDRWANAFEGLYTSPPNWYQTRHDGAFTMAGFAYSLNHSVSCMNTSLAAQPRSSGGGSSGGFGGGGSSGGGFGGGGGGAW